MVRRLIMWMVHRSSWINNRPLTPWPSEIRPMKRLANRYAPFLPDETQRGDNSIYKRLPIWAPFNVLLHHWTTLNDGNEYHDHPRWSLTICLKGELIERTPWAERVLTPGSIVLRSPRYIHGFEVRPEHACKTWTLFLVGRRRRPQNTYVVTRRTERPMRANHGRD